MQKIKALCKTTWDISCSNLNLLILMDPVNQFKTKTLLLLFVLFFLTVIILFSSNFTSILSTLNKFVHRRIFTIWSIQLEWLFYTNWWAIFNWREFWFVSSCLHYRNLILHLTIDSSHFHFTVFIAETQRLPRLPSLTWIRNKIHFYGDLLLPQRKMIRLDRVFFSK